MVHAASARGKRAVATAASNRTGFDGRREFDPVTGAIDGEYAAGLMGDLPGAYPIWYRFTGTLRPGTGQ
jgi:hypothetical protein